VTLDGGEHAEGESDDGDETDTESDSTR